MNLFGLGPLEVVAALVVALIALGPKGMMDMASASGKAIKELQRVSSEMSYRAEAIIRHESSTEEETDSEPEPNERQPS
ncbi:MAG: hypothetical protein HW403_1127 [Dehalococcoidia bacterium]|nr:hypothetical protein [Dehalococcoidia bacterium]